MNPTVYAYDKNGNRLIVYSASGAASSTGQLIANVWMQPVDVLLSDTMTIRGIPTDSFFIEIYNPSYAFKYELMPLSPFTGIEDLNEQNLFSVYPNPATDKINISLQNGINEDLPKVPSGNYFVSVRSKNGIESFRKIMIQNK